MINGKGINCHYTNTEMLPLLNLNSFRSYFISRQVLSGHSFVAGVLCAGKKKSFELHGEGMEMKPELQVIIIFHFVEVMRQETDCRSFTLDCVYNPDKSGSKLKIMFPTI
jgi:hypothetical protein